MLRIETINGKTLFFKFNKLSGYRVPWKKEHHCAQEKKTVTLGKYVIHMVDLRFQCYRTHNNDFRKDTLHVGCCPLKFIFLKFKGKVILHGVGYTISCGFSFS